MSKRQRYVITRTEFRKHDYPEVITQILKVILTNNKARDATEPFLEIVNRQRHCHPIRIVSDAEWISENHRIRVVTFDLNDAGTERKISYQLTEDHSEK